MFPMMAFSRSRGPRGPDRIADIEQNTGRALPPAYRDLVMATGGGICHPGMRVRFRKMQVRGRTVTRILGNGVLCDGAENSLDSAAVRDLAPDFRIISSAPLLRRPHSGSSSSGTGRCFRLHRPGLWPFSMTSTGFSTGGVLVRRLPGETGEGCHVRFRTDGGFGSCRRDSSGARGASGVLRSVTDCL